MLIQIDATNDLHARRVRTQTIHIHERSKHSDKNHMSQQNFSTRIDQICDKFEEQRKTGDPPSLAKFIGGENESLGTPLLKPKQGGLKPGKLQGSAGKKDNEPVVSGKK